MTISSGDAHDFCIYGSRHRVTFPILDADGDLVSGATGLDSERSLDQGTYTDVTPGEATEIATGSGTYYLDLTSTETTGKNISIIVKTTSVGAKTTFMSIPIVRLPVLRTGTAQAGAASTITLDSGASAKDNAYIGLYVQCTNDSPANVLGQTRKIISYVGSTKVATVEAAWGTNPSSATTFALLLPTTANVNAWLGQEPADPTTNGVPEVDVTHWSGTAVASPHTAGYPAVTIKDGTGTGEIDTTSGGVLVAAIANNAITAAAIATNAIDADALAADAVTEIQSGLATSASIAALNNISAAQVNAEVLDVLTVDTFAQPGQEAPAATNTLKNMLAYLFKGWRNKIEQTDTEYRLFNDDAATVDQKAAVSDAAGTLTRGEVGSGP